MTACDQRVGEKAKRRAAKRAAARLRARRRTMPERIAPPPGAAGAAGGAGGDAPPRQCRVEDAGGYEIEEQGTGGPPAHSRGGGSLRGFNRRGAHLASIPESRRGRLPCPPADGGGGGRRSDPVGRTMRPMSH